MSPLNRRDFLKLSAAAVAVGIAIPAFAAGREPYVQEGEGVIHIGLAGGFTGGAIVKEVLPWDGVGYPCVVWDQGFHTPRRTMPEPIYDTDLCASLSEISNDFWSRHDYREYPNVHAWVREQRYGEDPRTFWQRRDAAWAARAS